MTWGFWIIAISVGIVAVALVILIIYLIMMLLSLRETVNKMNRDIAAFDPLIRVVSGVGEVIEKKTKCVEKLSHEVDQSIMKEHKQKAEFIVNTALEVGEWAMIGVALWQKIKERRR